MKNSIGKDILSIGEVAHLLGVNVATLRNWHKLGLLQPHMTMGGHRRYAKCDIDKLLEKCSKVSSKISTQFKVRTPISKILFGRNN